MKFLEKDLEQIVFDTDPVLISSRGLDHFCGKWQQEFRQLNLGDYGIADIVTFNFETEEKNLLVQVYELKQETVNTGTLLQALGYCKGVNEIIKASKYLEPEWTIEFEIILIGSKIDNKSSFCYLPDFLTNVFLYTYRYDYDGIYFSMQNGYRVTNGKIPGNTQEDLDIMIFSYIISAEEREKRKKLKDAILAENEGEEF